MASFRPQGPTAGRAGRAGAVIASAVRDGRLRLCLESNPPPKVRLLPPSTVTRAVTEPCTYSNAKNRRRQHRRRSTRVEANHAPLSRLWPSVCTRRANERHQAHSPADVAPGRRTRPFPATPSSRAGPPSPLPYPVSSPGRQNRAASSVRGAPHHPDSIHSSRIPNAFSARRRPHARTHRLRAPSDPPRLLHARPAPAAS